MQQYSLPRTHEAERVWEGICGTDPRKGRGGRSERDGMGREEDKGRGGEEEEVWRDKGGGVEAEESRSRFATWDMQILKT
jgi:hypothetical protein